jgi:hypothetical protein
VAFDSGQVRGALVRQWRLVAAAVPTLDLEGPSRIDGWRNAEVVAHLAVQPRLLIRFLGTAAAGPAELDVAANLSGTGSFRDLIDASAREDAARGRTDLGAGVDLAVPVLDRADLSVTITTLQGSIPLVGYLVTRCIEAVVHGGDLVAAVTPDPSARSITAGALMEVLAATAPGLVGQAGTLSEARWIEVATGRSPDRDDLDPGLQVMA